MLTSLRAVPCARGSHSRLMAASLITSASLLLLPQSTSAASGDFYRPAARPACACGGVTTTAGFGTPYAAPAPLDEGRYRPLDGSPRYATGPNAPAPRRGYVSPYDMPAVWAGAYGGLNAGYGWGDTSVSAPGFGSTNPSGGLGGLHGGYNWQSGNIVFGGEADLDLNWAQSSTTYGSGNSLSSHPTWVSSLRGRAGYAFNNFMIYGTLGLALANTNLTLQQPGAITQMSETQFGYVIGLGGEMKIAPQISLRLEALHYGFADKNLSYGSSITPLSSSLNTVRAGISFHFN
jgi:outer membrane immunogenic protein